MKWILSIIVFAISGIITTASEVPDWVLHGILGVETSSFYHKNGKFHYANRKRGRHGELGPWQMTQAAFREVQRSGDNFERLAKDHVYARLIAIRYLVWLNSKLGGDWDHTVRAYNVGVAGSRRAGRGQEYLEDVRGWARRVGALPVSE